MGRSFRYSLNPLVVISALATLLGLPDVQRWAKSSWWYMDLLDDLLVFCLTWQPLLFYLFLVMFGFFMVERTLGLKRNTLYIYLDFWEGLKKRRFPILGLGSLVLVLNCLRAIPFLLERMGLSVGATEFRQLFGAGWETVMRFPLHSCNTGWCLTWIGVTIWVWRTETETAPPAGRSATTNSIKQDASALKLLRKAEKLIEKNRLLEAARIFEKLGKEYWYRAAKLLSQIGETESATEAFRQAGSHFLKQGQLGRAADAYYFGGLWERAIEAYEHAAPPRGSKGERELLDVMLTHWSESLGQLGRFEDAAKLLMRYEMFEQAAHYYQKAALPTDAAQAYLQAGSYEASFRALEEGGFGELAQLERGKYLVQQGRHEEAALEFEKLGHLEYAADAYAKGGHPLKAARCFMAANKVGRAAPLFLDGGEEIQAMNCYEQIGAYDKAAQLAAHLGLQDKQAQFYEQAGHLLLAAGSYLLIYETGDALRCLERVELEDEQSVQSLAQLITSLIDSGRVDEALACAAAVLEGRKTRKILAPLLFVVAKIHERMGKLEKASQFYFRAANLAPNHEEYVGAARHIAANLGIEYPSGEEYKSLDGPSKVLSGSASDSSDGLYRPPLVSGRHSSLPRQLEKMKSGSSESENGNETTLTLDGQTVYDLTSEGELSRYQVISELGRGGMGFVYKALDKKLNRMVAIKMLHPELNQDGRIVYFFKREAKTIAALNHPNLVGLFDMGKEKGCFYMIMEYVDGMTLKVLAAKSPQYVRRNLRGIWLETCAGLRYAHEKGFIHRDLKPSNLMFSKDRRIKILDFGLAKGITDMNHSAQIWGTPSYMAPELFGGGRAQFSSDIYGLGATFYVLATRKEPFEHPGQSRLAEGGLPRAPHLVDERIGMGLSEIIMRCLQPDPAKRYAGIVDLMADLRKL